MSFTQAKTIHGSDLEVGGSCGTWVLFLFVWFFTPDLHRWAVFLLLQLGEDIQDTEMVLVDRTLTDISFQTSLLL